MINFTKPKSRLNYTKVNEIFNKFLEIKEIDPSLVKVLFLLNLFLIVPKKRNSTGILFLLQSYIEVSNLVPILIFLNIIR